MTFDKEQGCGKLTDLVALGAVTILELSLPFHDPHECEKFASNENSHIEATGGAKVWVTVILDNLAFDVRPANFGED